MPSAGTGRRLEGDVEYEENGMSTDTIAPEIADRAHQVDLTEAAQEKVRSLLALDLPWIIDATA